MLSILSCAFFLSVCLKILNYICTFPFSKQGYIHRFRGLRHGHMFLWSPHSTQYIDLFFVPIVHSMLSLISILMNGYTTLCLSICILMDIWIVFNLWLLGKKIFGWTFLLCKWLREETLCKSPVHSLAGIIPCLQLALQILATWAHLQSALCLVNTWAVWVLLEFPISAPHTGDSLWAACGFPLPVLCVCMCVLMCICACMEVHMYHFYCRS